MPHIKVDTKLQMAAANFFGSWCFGDVKEITAIIGPQHVSPLTLTLVIINYGPIIFDILDILRANVSLTHHFDISQGQV